MMIEIPDFLSHLPVFQGLPVPYMVPIDGRGVPAFRVIDTEKWLNCVEQKLCAICGIRVVRFFFIGGESCRYNHLFHDPAMHRHCARFSATICPFLAGDIGYSAAPYPTIPGTAVVTKEAVSNKRPARMYIFRTSRFTLVGGGLIKAGPWSGIEEIVCQQATE
jgi:hypothetical protein